MILICKIWNCSLYYFKENQNLEYEVTALVDRVEWDSIIYGINWEENSVFNTSHTKYLKE